MWRQQFDKDSIRSSVPWDPPSYRQRIAFLSALPFWSVTLGSFPEPVGWPGSRSPASARPGRNRPALASAVMGVVVFFVYSSINYILFFVKFQYISNVLATIMSILIGMVTYAFVLILVGGIDGRDIQSMPARVTRLMPKFILRKVSLKKKLLWIIIEVFFYKKFSFIISCIFKIRIIK